MIKLLIAQAAMRLIRLGEIKTITVFLNHNPWIHNPVGVQRLFHRAEQFHFDG